MSQPPEYPGPPDPQGGGQDPPGYPPPPPPGYGAPPPGYGGPPAPAFSIGDAFGWAWNAFSKNPVALIVPALVYGILIGVASALVGLSQSVGTTTTGSDDDYFTFTANLNGGGMTLLILGYLVAYLVGAFAQAAFLSGCLDLADGRPVTVGSFFKPRNFGMVFLAALLVGILTSIASALCFLPGLILGIFAQFTIPFAIDRSEQPIKALTSSFSTVTANFGNALLVWLVEVALFVVGALACGVGLLVAAPVASLIGIYAYRKFSGGQVVAPQQAGYQPGPPPGPAPA
ncbi:hypothetical protein [Mycobacterium paraintracellulare]|uniref:hypothetical protein n=1 Tax=Mycobacterium paraintracellulare TaxID=1138383 RepID=UPI00192800EE|nr:hypothetical protein [Mycobacterium paraintracellulare]BCP16342.1 hypothetical protein MINTM021_32510 [Mycobacterium paraintracellulare]